MSKERAIAFYEINKIPPQYLAQPPYAIVLPNDVGPDGKPVKRIITTVDNLINPAAPVRMGYFNDAGQLAYVTTTQVWLFGYKVE